jgi:type IV pilus assembly protein PilO
MSKFNELPTKTQIGIIIGAALALSAALYFVLYKNIVEQNQITAQQLASKRAENDQLRPFQHKLADLNRQIDIYKQQLEIQKNIVPDEKEADQFMHLLQNVGSSAGIYIRRYTAKGINTREFYTEVPFEIEVDGPYYSMLSFFEKIGKLERIINVSGLAMSTVSKPADAKAKKKYEYAPGESVVATCNATTFFSHDAVPEPAADATKKGAKPAAPVKK